MLKKLEVQSGKIYELFSQFKNIFKGRLRHRKLGVLGILVHRNARHLDIGSIFFLKKYPVYKSNLKSDLKKRDEFTLLALVQLRHPRDDH